MLNTLQEMKDNKILGTSKERMYVNLSLQDNINHISIISPLNMDVHRLQSRVWLAQYLGRYWLVFIFKHLLSHSICSALCIDKVQK